MSKLLKIASLASATFLALGSKILAQSDSYYSLGSDYYSTTGSDAAAAAFFSGFSVVMCVVSLVGLVIWIVLTVWIYKDAKKHNPDQALLWAALTFLFGLLGLVIYLVVGRKQVSNSTPTVSSTPTTPVEPAKEPETPVQS